MAKQSSGPEYKEQSQVATYLSLSHPDILYTCSVAGVFANLGMVMKMLRLGYRKGTPDLLLFAPRFPYHGFFIEMKAPGGKVSPEQEKFLSQAVALGYATAVCWSAKEAIRDIEKYLLLPPYLPLQRPLEPRSPEPPVDPFS